MNNKPILFSADMIRAIQHGTKTQTRRIYKLPKGWRYCNYDPDSFAAYPEIGKTSYPKCEGEYFATELDCLENPYGQAGDLLWVKETFNKSWLDNGKILYRADGGSAKEAGYDKEPKWMPCIFMRRAYSRITLKITDVRVERLQDISRGDCMAEGCPFPNVAKETDPVRWFSGLWDAINKDRGFSWQSNPFVWVIEFEPIFQNIDDYLNNQYKGEGDDTR